MRIQINEITAVRIFSTNLQKSRDWYQALFGQEPVCNTELFVSFKIGGAFFDIAVHDAKNPFSQGGSVGYWLVNDLSALLKKVEELGGKPYRGPLNVSETQRTIVQIQDPFGNIIGFEAPLVIS